MENRQPTYPGRVKLTPVAGQANVYDMERADEPTVEGTPLNKSTLLQDATCEILDIPSTSVPNDAFVKLALGIGKYGYVIHVQYQDGSPAEGFTLTGLNAPDGTEAVTNETGEAVGVSTAQSVSVGVKSPFIDIQDVSETEIQSTGILTQHTFTVARKDQILVQNSGTVAFSPDVATYDLCAVGGGGGGNVGGQNTTPGSGGGGGYVSNLLGVSKSTYPSILIAVGAGGVKGVSAGLTGNGGTTTVSSGDIQLLTATGGNGAHASDQYSTSPGTGNGNGGQGAYGSNINTTERNNANGTDGNGYIFNDSNLGIAGGGGGGGFLGSYNDATGQTPATGGTPNGAFGATEWYTNSFYDAPAGPAGIGGGGGGGMSTISASTGGNGAVYIRCHYTDEVAA